MPRAPIAPLLERIHCLEGHEDAWYGGIVALLGERHRAHSGVIAYRFERVTEAPGCGYRSCRIPSGVDADIDLTRYDAGLPVLMAQVLYGTGTKAELAAPLLRGANGRVLDFVQEDLDRLRAKDILGMICDDGTGRGLALSIPTRSPHQGAVSELKETARHIASMLRLRRHLARSASPERVWLDSGGSVVDTEGVEVTNGLRARLREWAREWARARDTCHHDGAAALGMWRNLLEGTWSFLDFEELGGQRRVIAYRNPDATRGFRALTGPERLVAERSAQGRSNKEIALDLGLAEPTVANHLVRALAKLGMPDRMVLIQSFAALMERR